MRMKKGLCAFTIISTFAAACGDDNSDAERLARFRSALPTTEQLSAPHPSDAGGNAVGDPALYPIVVLPAVIGINVGLGLMVGILRFVTSLPPTSYDEDEKQYIWGPFDNNDGVGKVAVTVQEQDEGEDFRYFYAMFRVMEGATNDALTPVIFGGANPGAGDHGSGVMVIDFEASRAFEDTHDPGHGMTMDAGRIAAVFAKGYEDDVSNPGVGQNEAAFVLAIFNDFLPKNDPGGTPVDLEYFFGGYNDVIGGNRVAFLDMDVDGVDTDVPADGMNEDLDINMVFLNQGAGRSEASVTGGTLGTGLGTAVECWDNDIERLHLDLNGTPEGGGSWSYAEGLESDCLAPFDQSLSTLGLPTLATLEAEDTDDVFFTMRCVTEQGVQALDSGACDPS